jgi:predicted nucleic acid-binding protein
MSYRIVVETNVLVSAVLNQRGSPALILEAVLDGEVFSSNIAVWSLKKSI